MSTSAVVLSVASLLLAGLPLVRIRSRATLVLLLPDFLGTAWAPYVALAGALGAALGLLSGSVLAVVAGAAGCLLAADYVRRVTAPNDSDFERAFGSHWRERLGAETTQRMVERRWSWRVPSAPEARCTHDVAFWTLPGSERKLLCDIWQPPVGIPPSGLAVVYLHGSAWYLIDKDVGTRPFFRHLAAQGHIVMDVAYRLCPETNFIGMVGDAKRAVAWMKAHAAEYGARPEQVVLMGGSAGGHIALLAAYTDRHPALTPADLRQLDTSVLAVVSYYGVPDLRAYEAFARRFQVSAQPSASAEKKPLGPLGRLIYRVVFGRALKPEQLPPPPPHRQIMRDLVGGLPDEVPEAFEMASPSHHVNAESPPTLLFQGANDNIIPVESARSLRDALSDAGVPSVYVEFARTPHAFDLVIPPLFGPAGQAALYDVERFLACVGSQTRAARRPSGSAIRTAAVAAV